MGFYAVNSHRIVDCQRCLLQPEEFNRAMEAFRQWAAAYGDPVVRRGQPLRQNAAAVLAMGGTVRPGAGPAWWSTATGSITSRNWWEQLKAAVPGLASVVINSNRERTNVALGQKSAAPSMGRTPSRTGCAGCGSSSPPSPFYQVNRGQAERLYGLAGEYAQLTGGGAAAGFILRRGDHWALPGGEGPAAAGGGNHPGGGGECPGKRQAQRH